MREKRSEKARAIGMRKKGKTYSEILAEIPVAKSTLSLWLRSVGLAEPQKQRITKKRIAAQKRGARTRHENRTREIESLIVQGIKDVGHISERELWLLGIALYWAEGSKQNANSISAGIQFNNSDVRMIQVFLAWLRHMEIEESDIGFDLYMHDNRKGEQEQFREWWARELGIARNRIQHVYFKRHKLHTNRTNIGDLYHGLLRVKVMASTVLNRKIAGWVHGIVAGCRVV